MVKKLLNVQQKYIDSLHLDSIFTKRLTKSRKIVMIVAADPPSPPPSDIILYITRFLFQTSEYSAVDKYLFTTLSRIVMSRNVMSRIVCVTNCLSRIVMSRIVCIPFGMYLFIMTHTHNIVEINLSGTTPIKIRTIDNDCKLNYILSTYNHSNNEQIGSTHTKLLLML